MERRLKTPDLFKFPYFEAICWYVAKNLLEMLKGEYSFYVHKACKETRLTTHSVDLELVQTPRVVSHHYMYDVLSL